MTPSTDFAPTSHRCAECLNRLAETEMIQLGGAWVCATCKPQAVAKLAQGLGVGRFWRKGRRYVVANAEPAVVFPGLCVRCGEPATEAEAQHAGKWLIFKPWPAFTSGMGWRYGYCDRHYRRKVLADRIATVTVTAAVVLYFFASVIQPGWLRHVSLILLGASFVLRRIFVHKLRVVRRTATHAFFANCGEAFLAEFPEWKR